jgi:predicted transcriptional regulator of viral defense system
LEYYGLADASVLESLRGMLTATYQRLDPLLPAEGVFLSRWRLRLNVTPEELDATRLG